jgi:transposase
VRDELTACGWQVEVADARKVKTVAPLAAKTDKVDARLLAELCRRGLVPALWLPSLNERALRERLRRRMHLVRLRTSGKGRIFGGSARISARPRTTHSTSMEDSAAIAPTTFSPLHLANEW